MRKTHNFPFLQYKLGLDAPPSRSSKSKAPGKADSISFFFFLTCQNFLRSPEPLNWYQTPTHKAISLANLPGLLVLEDWLRIKSPIVILKVLYICGGLWRWFGHQFEHSSLNFMASCLELRFVVPIIIKERKLFQEPVCVRSYIPGWIFTSITSGVTSYFPIELSVTTVAATEPSIQRAARAKCREGWSGMRCF